MHIAICDDDSTFRLILRSLLSDFYKINRLPLPDLMEFGNAKELLAYTGEIDILFVDVEMQGMNGISAAYKLKETNKNIIIFVITAHEEYLDHIFELKAFRYLPKPLERARLYRNYKQALKEYLTPRARLTLETKEETLILPAESIIMISALHGEVTVYTKKRNLQALKTLNDLKTILPENCFYQSHRSYIVNLQYVNRFTKDLIYLDNDNLKAYLTQRKYTDFKKTCLLFQTTFC